MQLPEFKNEPLSDFKGNPERARRMKAALAEVESELGRQYDLRRTGATAHVLAASIRHPEHAVTAAKLGCDVATIPGKVLRQMLAHPLTTAGIERFAADWETRPEFGEWLTGLTAGRAVSA